MALFTEKGAGGMGGGDAVAGLSIIGTGMRVVGDVTADGVVKVEGTVVGTVQAAKQVLVAKGGEVEGDVITREAIIGGEVRGAVYAEERVELQATSVIHGDIATKRLFVQEGGEINGVLRMGEDAGHPPHQGHKPSTGSRHPAPSAL
jgi:cytoskeletal protein CcmA (bactofilin family)